MLRFLLALVIIASAAVITQKLNLFDGLFPKSSHTPAITPPPAIAEPTDDTNKITKSEVYRWVDDEGKVHFSDRKIDNKESELERITVSTETTEFAKTPKIKTVYVPSHRQTGSQTSRSARCQRLKSEIAKREKYLRKSGRIPSQDSQLSEKRWEKIKGC